MAKSGDFGYTLLVLCQLYFCGLAKTETQQPSNVSNWPTHKLNIAKALASSTLWRATSGERD